MATQWPQHYQQPQDPAYAVGPYQQQYSQHQGQQPNPQYVFGQQQAGQPYMQPASAQHHYFQQQQQQSAQQTQYQQPPVISGPPQQHYQQLYAPQQPSPTQQYGPAQQQQAAYQAYVTPMQALPAVAQIQPNHNCCFNCGSADHWAQSCPEPKKQPGSSAGQSTVPSTKQQKFKAPVVTKYAVPPHVAQAQAFQQQAARQAWQGPVYGQPGYQQYPIQQQMSYGPATPVSAQAPPDGRWPQGTPYPQFKQGPQAVAAPQQPGVYPQYPQAPTPQDPAQYHGPHPPHQMSPIGQQGSPVQHQYPPNIQPPPVTQVPPHSAASPHSRASSVSHAQYSQHPYSQGVPVANVQQAPTPSQAHSHSRPTIPVQHRTQSPSVEPEEDDLKKLDIPDIPLTEGFNATVLVGRPLPTNFVVADALAPFAPPALGDNGLCKSKYRNDADVETQNVKETSEWNNHKKDPIFASISDDGKVVSLRALDAIYRPHLIEQVKTPILDISQASVYNKGHHARHVGERDVMNSLEDALHKRHTKYPLNEAHRHSLGKRPRSPSHEDDSYRRELDSRSSWRGVVRDSRRVKAPHRPYPPPTPQEHYEENSQDRRSRSASPRKYDSGSHQYVSPPDSAFDDQSHQIHQGLVTQYRRESNNGRDRSLRWEEDPYSHQSDPPPPPPPPPPPMRKASWYDGPSSSPPSAGLPARDPFEPDSDDNMQNDDFNVSNGHMADAPVVSPVKLRSERAYLRRRESTRDESSEEEDTPGRRQADDVTPKLKRRQPKVAAAYSRRW